MASSELLILGAGPAGCAAALTWLASGHSVTLLETEGASRKIPGETLHPAAEPLFRQLGIWDEVMGCGFHRHAGIWREDESGRRTFTPYGRDENGDWLGIQADRPALNAILRQKVVELGGTLRRVKRLESACRKKSPVWRLRADGEDYETPMLFDATGHRGWLTKKLDIPCEYRGPAQRLSFGWIGQDTDEFPRNPLFKRHAEGWDWLAPLAAGRSAWAKLRRAPNAAGMDATWRIFRECAGAGYFLLGDAASYMDPSAANGVLRAMMSGIYAANLAGGVAGGGDPDAAAREYCRWVSQLFDTTYAAGAVPNF